jgi:hypothetical protein
MVATQVEEHTNAMARWIQISANAKALRGYLLESQYVEN